MMLTVNLPNAGSSLIDGSRDLIKITDTEVAGVVNGKEYAITPDALRSSTAVIARYNTSAGQAINSGADTVINYNNKVIDTHSAVATGASWSFTAPVEGYYNVAAQVFFSSATWTETQDTRLGLYKNGSIYSRLGWNNGLAGTDFNSSQCTPDIVQLDKNDTIDIRIFHSQGGSIALDTAAPFNWVSIFRI